MSRSDTPPPRRPRVMGAVLLAREATLCGTPQREPARRHRRDRGVVQNAQHASVLNHPRLPWAAERSLCRVLRDTRLLLDTLWRAPVCTSADAPACDGSGLKSFAPRRYERSLKPVLSRPRPPCWARRRGVWPARPIRPLARSVVEFADDPGRPQRRPAWAGWRCAANRKDLLLSTSAQPWASIKAPASGSAEEADRQRVAVLLPAARRDGGHDDEDDPATNRTRNSGSSRMPTIRTAR